MVALVIVAVLGFGLAVGEENTQSQITYTQQ